MLSNVPLILVKNLGVVCVMLETIVKKWWQIKNTILTYHFIVLNKNVSNFENERIFCNLIRLLEKWKTII